MKAPIEKEPKTRITVLGNINVGIHRLVARMSGQSLAKVEAFDEKDTIEKNTTILSRDGTVEFYYGPTGTTDPYTQNNFFQGKNPTILVCDLTDLQSIAALPMWTNEIRAQRDIATMPVILVGNKSDQIGIDKQITYPELARLLAEALGIHYIETSATTGHNVDKLLQEATQRTKPQPNDRVNQQRTGLTIEQRAESAKKFDAQLQDALQVQEAMRTKRRSDEVGDAPAERKAGATRPQPEQQQKTGPSVAQISQKIGNKIGTPLQKTTPHAAQQPNASGPSTLDLFSRRKPASKSALASKPAPTPIQISPENINCLVLTNKKDRDRGLGNQLLDKFRKNPTGEPDSIDNYATLGDKKLSLHSSESFFEKYKNSAAKEWRKLIDVIIIPMDKETTKSLTLDALKRDLAHVGHTSGESSGKTKLCFLACMEGTKLPDEIKAFAATNNIQCVTIGDKGHIGQDKISSEIARNKILSEINKKAQKIEQKAQKSQASEPPKPTNVEPAPAPAPTEAEQQPARLRSRSP